FILFLIINIPSPIKVQGDGVFYYGWATSVIFDYDIDLTNQLESVAEYDFYSKKFIEEKITTVTGYVPNPYAFGTAILWSPFVILAKIIENIWQTGNFETDGYSAIYMFSINFASFLFGVLAFFVVYKTLLFYFDRKISFLSVFVMWLSTPWIYYQFFEPSMSHSASLMMVSLFFWYSMRAINIKKYSWWIFGSIVFLMIAVRWQNVLFVIVIAPLFVKYFSKRINIESLIAIFFGSAFFVFLQMIFWKLTYGSYILIPQGNAFLGKSFYFVDTLFSTNRGFLLWSPIIFLSIMGFFYIFRKNKLIAIICISAFLFQWLLNSVLSDPGGGDAFGGRRFINTIPFLSVSLAAFFEKFWHKKIIFIGVGALIAWNFILIENYRNGSIPHQGTFNIFEIDYFF
ncbi:MAG: hypothetical protein ABFQ53_02790, partial [Patescibacteria group bacterium]